MLGVIKTILGSQSKSRKYEDFRFGEYPPTKKQFGYACSLGIEIKDGMTNYELSRKISIAKLIRDLGITVTRKMDDKQIERLIIKTPVDHKSIDVRMLHWDMIADADISALMIYEWKNEMVIDVFGFNEAEIRGKKDPKIILSISEPELCNDKDIGNVIEWENIIKIPESAIWYFQPVIPRLHHSDHAGYKKLINQGVKIAKRMEKNHRKSKRKT